VPLHLHRSNRSELLVDALADVLRQPVADPFAAEVIAVQSKGMERWLALELSARLGVLANAREGAALLSPALASAQRG
jgi:exodeoxyribonuclease V gamma subunit